MAKLRHIALHTPDPEKTAEFYKQVFDMVEVGRTDSPIAKGIYLSDGTINLAVLRFKTLDEGPIAPSPHGRGDTAKLSV